MKLSEVNLCDLSRFEDGCPAEVFELLRREAPVWFHPATEEAPDGEGFWVISRNSDARDVLKNFEVFSSETGAGAREGGGTVLPDLSTDMAPGLVLSMMDPPKHDDIRGLVNQGFFPRTLKFLEGQMREESRDILSGLPESGEIDFLDLVATELPLRMICAMAGLPREDWPRMKEWADAAVEYAAFDPESDRDRLLECMTEMGTYAFEHIGKLRAAPDRTLLCEVVHAEIPGEDGQPRRLDDLEAIRFFNLLITGGTETTRNAIAGGYYALLTHPAQLRALEERPEELLDGAVEEILRWSSPVHFNRRTAAKDFELHGRKIKRGDKVTVWYSSANRDESVFDNPHEFDIRRPNANKHIAFGYGIHHCLGAALARMEIRIMLEELLEHMKDRRVEAHGGLKFIRSNRHQGVSRMKIFVHQVNGR